MYGRNQSLVAAAGSCSTEEVSEHRAALSLSLLASLVSFCIYYDLCVWMGTSEAIKVIWRQTVPN